MEAIKEIALSVSVSAAVIGTVYIICPDGNMSRQMKYIIGLIMLLSVVTPVIKADIEIETVSPSKDYVSDATEMIKSQSVYIAEKLLAAEKISYDRILVNTDILSDNNIIISNVCVYGAKDKEKTLAALSEYFKEVEIKFYD